MDRLLQDFIERLFESRDRTALQATMAAVSAALELPFFAYLAAPAGLASPPVLISNYPAAWTAHYVRRGYQQIDPVLRQAVATSGSFIWGPELNAGAMSGAERRLFDEAASFDIRHGLTFPLLRGGAFAAMTFAAGEPRALFARRLRRQARLLGVMALCFHAQARRNLLIDRDAARPLSPRERECIGWAAEGKSCWEIGQILNISRRTVAFHLDNAKSKLGVRTNIQAVAALKARP